MVYCYIRLTGADNDARGYQKQVTRFGMENRLGKINFVVEQTTLVKDWERTQLGILISEARKGDLLIVPDLLMFSKSLIQLGEIVSQIHSKEVWLAALAQDLTFSGEQNDYNEGMLKAFLTVSDLERSLISQRMKLALEKRRSEGGKLGRPSGSGRSLLDDFKDEILQAKDAGVKNVVLAKKYKTTPQNISKWLKKNAAPKVEAGIKCQLYCVGAEGVDLEPVFEYLADAGAMIRALVDFSRSRGNRGYTDRDVMLNAGDEEGAFLFISDSEQKQGFILSWPVNYPEILVQLKNAGITAL